MELITKWLNQAGIIKKLQVTIALSLVINIFLAQQILKLNKDIDNLKNPAMQKLKTKSKPNLEQARIFAREYLEQFFSKPDKELIGYLHDHSEENLFIKNIYPELVARSKQNIESELEIQQLYIEENGAEKVKAICFAREQFLSGNYATRNLSIELIIDMEQMKVNSIPVFKVET